jgi:uncharacterized protein DUF6496
MSRGYSVSPADFNTFLACVLRTPLGKNSLARLQQQRHGRQHSFRYVQRHDWRRNHFVMPKEEAIERAREDERKGKAPSTQAGEFVREEMEHIREGEHGARSPEQAIAIGLSKARRAGVKLPPPKRGKAQTKRQAKRDLAKGRAGSRKKPSRKRSRATKRALKGERRRSASRRALSRHSKRVARRRSARSRSAAAKKAARTRKRYR